MATAQSDYAQVAFIDLQQGTTGGSDDNYAVVMDDVVKDTNDGTKYIVTAWNGSENITIKTDDSTVKNLKSGALITYSGDLNDADVTVKADRDDNNYFVSNYDAASGDINLMSGTLTADASVAGKYTGALEVQKRVVYRHAGDILYFIKSELQRLFTAVFDIFSKCVVFAHFCRLTIRQYSCSSFRAPTGYPHRSRAE